jgi:methionine sulfoxide reductase catalytic subunit
VVTTYNNFYEFGPGKEDPSRLADRFTPTPWTVRIDGLVERPGDYALEDFLHPTPWRTGSTGCAAWRRGPW